METKLAPVLTEITPEIGANALRTFLQFGPKGEDCSELAEAIAFLLDQIKTIGYRLEIALKEANGLGERAEEMYRKRITLLEETEEANVKKIQSLEEKLSKAENLLKESELCYLPFSD